MGREAAAEVFGPAQPIAGRDPARPSPVGMRERVRAFDWSATPLGPRSGWPLELRICVEQMLESGFPKAIAWGPELVTIYNDAFLPILGDKPEALGRSFRDVWAEVWEEIGPIADRALGGISTYIEDLPLVINRSGADEKAWFTFCYSPLRLADGTVGGMLDTVVETTGKVHARADLALANQELGHRLKNMLALVQSLAMQTLGRTGDRQALQAFGERLQALGHAHDILLRRNLSSASLHEVITASIEPHNGTGQIEVDGPDLPIGARAAVTISLMLNELATNAIKYGGLSRPAGRVALSWSATDDRFRLYWHERDGPEVREPPHAGFGSKLIDHGLGSRSKVRRRYAASGLQVEIETPVSELAL